MPLYDDPRLDRLSGGFLWEFGQANYQAYAGEWVIRVRADAKFGSHAVAIDGEYSYSSHSDTERGKWIRSRSCGRIKVVDSEGESVWAENPPSYRVKWPDVTMKEAKRVLAELYASLCQYIVGAKITEAFYIRRTLEQRHRLELEIDGWRRMAIRREEQLVAADAILAADDPIDAWVQHHTLLFRGGF